MALVAKEQSETGALKARFDVLEEQVAPKVIKMGRVPAVARQGPAVTAVFRESIGSPKQTWGNDSPRLAAPLAGSP